MKARILRALESGLSLNSENEDLFFDWLDRVSPHRQPPFLCGPDETVCIAARELGWIEEFTPIQRSGTATGEWLEVIDDASIEEMAAVVRRYLETYPHKQDGLCLVVLSRDGTPRTARRLIERIRQREFAKSRIELHLLSPRAFHEAIARAFDEAAWEDEPDGDDLFPAVQLVLHDWSEDSAEQTGLSRLANRVDVAIAPNLFGARTAVQAQTRAGETGQAGSFNPWVDATSHDVEQGGRVETENVAKILLPPTPDPWLESWSTLNVRRNRNSPVSPQQESNTDYLALQVRFDSNRRLFSELHAAAHWVITLDPFVGREQIDALAFRPDIILVKSRVGKNESYTMVVSSNSGRQFVTSRLERKLVHDLAISEASLPARDIAHRFYEVGRNVVPGVVLRALGLGRGAQEVIGLVVSRFVVSSWFPVADDHAGIEVWLSLDEHLSWFGGPQRLRADMARFVFRLVDDELRLAVLAVESKFRRSEDAGIAMQQLDRTTALLAEAFGSALDPAGEKDDAVFWRHELASAIEQTTRRPMPISDLPAFRRLGQQAADVDAHVLDLLRAGRYTLESVDGCAVIIGYGVPTRVEHESVGGAHRTLLLHRPELLDVIERIVHGEPPPTRTEPPSPTPTDPSEPVLDEGPPLQPTRGPSPADGPDHPADAPSSDSADSRVPSGHASETSAAQAPRGIPDDELSRRYEQLLDTLDALGIKVGQPDETRWEQGPGFFVLRVVPQRGTTVDRLVSRTEELKLALGLEREQHIRSYVDRGTVVFEIPKHEDERYSVWADDLWARSPERADALVVPVGEDINGDLVEIDFSSADSPHLLVAGTTGSGKSVALETLLQGLCRRYPASKLRIRLVDPKSTELVEFEEDPHLDGSIGMDADDAVELLESAVEEMQRRYVLLKEARVRSLPEFNARVSEPNEQLPWIVLVLDEYADLTSDPEDKARIERALKRLAQKARASGIHVVIATQKPSAEVLSTTIRSNLPAQLALRVKTASDSRIIMDESGAETLAGKGDAFLKTARGVVRMQTAAVRPD